MQQYRNALNSFFQEKEAFAQAILDATTLRQHDGYLDLEVHADGTFKLRNEKDVSDTRGIRLDIPVIQDEDLRDLYQEAGTPDDQKTDDETLIQLLLGESEWLLLNSVREDLREALKDRLSERVFSTDRLIWNGNNYACDYGDGRMLYVDGDAWLEARSEQALELLRESYPGVSKETLQDILASGSKEAYTCLDKVEEELLSPSIWSMHAIECRYNEEGNLLPLNKGEEKIHDFSAWIV